MTKRLIRLALVTAAALLVGFLVVVFLPLAVAVSYSWRGAFPDRRRSTLPEWIAAVAMALLAIGVRRSASRRELKA
jgi:hypothetical protein